MAIFSGLRSKRGGRRESLFGTNSDDQPTSKPNNNNNNHLNATDVLGDSPSFASRTTRPPSESASLRNRTSSSNMLRLFGSGKRSASTSHHDGPPPSATSSKAEKRNVSGSASDAGHRSSRVPSQATTARNGNNGHAGGPVFSQNNGSTTESLSSAPAAPRPSDLFAGKGVNWDQLKLAGGTVSTTDSKRTDELQNYLKARRQWIPTFKTDSSAADGEKAPANLEEVSFGGAPAAPAGLMTLKDLEASHDRKQRLLSDLPISSGFTAGESPASPIAAGSSSSTSKPALISRPSQSSSIRGVNDLQPARNQSFRQSPFVGGALTSSGSTSTMKNNNNAVAAAGAAAASPLQRTVSPTGSTSKTPLSPTRKPPPSAASALLDSSSSSGVKPNGNANPTDTTPTKPLIETVSAPPRKSSVAGPLINGAGTQDSGSSGATVTPGALAVPSEASAAGGEASTLASAATSDVAATAPSSASAHRVRPSMDSTTGFATPEARSEAAHAEQTPRVG